MITPETSYTFSQPSEGIQSLNKWVFETIRPFIKGRTLEIGSGTNSLCPLFSEYNRPIHLSDTNQFYLQTLRDTYKDNPFVRAVHDFDFSSAEFQQSNPDTTNVFDTVIALNVSLTDSGNLVDNIKFVLRPGGTLAVIVPAYTYIYDGLGQNLYDWKRYNWKDMSSILMHKFSIQRVRYLNLKSDSAKNYFSRSGLSALATVRNK